VSAPDDAGGAAAALEFLEDARRQFRGQKKLVERALAQVGDDAYFAALDSESNSIALLVKHVAGNLRSRWTDFRTTDGEKPDRRRDSEFELEPGDSRAALTARWEEGWARAFAALDSLGVADLTRTVTIRGEPHSVAKAVTRSLGHNAYHAGQIVLLAKHHAGARWETLSIARGKSDEYRPRRR
jgi:uncharacterized damage-inducible protein DinB